jgi:hypothetical protein
MSEPRTSIRGLLHDVNDELSVAVMELELLLEGPGLDGAARESLASSLEACRRAAGSLKQVWRDLGSSGEVR